MSEKTHTDEKPVGMVILVQTSAGVFRQVMMAHPKHNNKVLGLVKHLQGGTLVLSRDAFELQQDPAKPAEA